MATTAIVLVNYNGHTDTIECLESLLRLDEGDFRVVIVDNASRDGSVAAIAAWASGDGDVPASDVWATLPARRRWPAGLRRLSRAEAGRLAPDDARVTLIEAGGNLGFAGANNLAMQFAAQDPETAFFWVLNNDTVVKPDALSRLLGHAQGHPEQGIMGAVLLYYHQPGVVQGVGGWIQPSRAMAGHIGFGAAHDALPDQAAIDADLAYVMGASMFARRAVHDAIGGMSEDFFLYFEELDWARRLPPGVGLGVCLDAVVYHKEGGSIGTDSIGRPSDTSLYYYAVNTLRYYWLHERRHAHMALARVVWNGIGHARARDGAAVRVTARAIADALSGRRRRGPYGGGEFRAPHRRPAPDRLR